VVLKAAEIRGSGAAISAGISVWPRAGASDAACWRDRTLADILRHHGCGGRAARAELLTGIEGVSSRSVRRIVLLADWRGR
jgi:hypothetical protein